MGTFIEETGNMYGKWTVVKRDGSSKTGSATWWCRCDCGTEKSVTGVSLRYGASMGCVHCSNHIEETGNRYGNLTVISREENDSRGKTRWLCECECGNLKIANGEYLRAGDTTHCGCMYIPSGRLAHGDANFNKLLYTYKRNASKRNLEWEISVARFRELTKKDCFYCGDVPSSVFNNGGNSNGGYVYNGVDRVDNSVGYTFENSVSCCSICNMMKLNLDIQVFLEKIERIYERHF